MSTETITSQITPPRADHLDERGRQIVEAYWQVSGFGEHGEAIFASSVRAIGTDFGITHSEVVKVIHKCSAALCQTECPECRRPLMQLVKTRSELGEFLTDIHYKKCSRCQTAQTERASQEQAKRDEVERQSVEEKMAKSVEAYKAEVYLSLKSIELRVLIELTQQSGTTHDVYKRVGISRERGNAIFQYLQDLHLVVRNAEACTYKIPAEGWTKLRNLKIDARIQPVLNPMEREIFRRLKARNAVVFPHQLLRTFVSEQVATEMLALFPDISQTSFLMMQVDFVILDEDYRPMRCVEYRGEHHQNADAREQRLDVFRRAVCGAAGVPLTTFEKSDLWKSEELRASTTAVA